MRAQAFAYNVDLTDFPHRRRINIVLVLRVQIDSSASRGAINANVVLRRKIT